MKNTIFSRCLAALSAVAIYWCMAVATSPPPSPSEYVNLNISVEMDSNRFVLSNSDSINVDSATLRFNARLDSVGNLGFYKKHHYNLAVGEVDTVPFSEFTTNRGESLEDVMRPLRGGFYLKFPLEGDSVQGVVEEQF